MANKVSRIRRARKTRGKIAELKVHRLCVHRTLRHTYAQVISPDTGVTVASASSLEAKLRKAVKHTGNMEAAKKVGETVAKRAQEKGVVDVAFDRSGFRYHGRVKALADAAREAGLKF